MKRLIFNGLLLAGLTSPVFAQRDCCPGLSSRPKVYRDVATHESMMEAAKGRENPLASLPEIEVSKEVSKAKPFQPQSLLSRSKILNRGGQATLVPKQAVLHVPPRLEPSIGMKSGDQLINWAQFFRVNRGWIKTVEVTRAQAEGRSPLPEEMVEKFAKCTQVVVATYQTGPISVLPYVEPEESSEESNPVSK